jgi:enoyl-CoA hydratase
MAPTQLEMQDGVAVLRMAYGKASVLDDVFCEHLIDRFDALLDDAAVRAVVLTGSGHIFSGGVDLRRLVDGGPDYVRVFVPRLGGLFRVLFAFAKPLVAAINGHAIAGGCVMACAADHRIMARGKGRIGVPELRVGVPFPTAALEAVRFACAPQHVQRLVLDGDTYDADRALPLGLVDEVSEPERLPDAALAVARRLAERPADAFALTKRQLRGPTLERMALATEVDQAVGDAWLDPDTRARVEAWVAKTMGG